MNRRAVLSIVGVVAVLIVVVALTTFLRDDKAGPEAQIEGLQTFSGLTNTHVEGNVAYDHTPPAGGDHFAAWMDCGVYDTQVADELAVHNIEHGGIWIAYDPDALDDAQVAALADQVPDNGIMTPYAGLDAPVVVTSWERQVALDGVDDPRLRTFVDTYENNPIAPESGLVTCTGGVDAAEAAQIAQQYGL
ncbi:DUF3105 domain-containing protein [Nocardioides rubriscoriae]|uniref:DUF3105 domain-containing protein n=1 Tax=Nocardioides rubriscoriae TaxID=642762 RepID=UPI0011DFFFDE|nr:DUF3105 domain-containing protein [Nocardioides rubriscoriae]